MNELVSHPLSDNRLFDVVQTRMQLRQYSAETIKAYTGQLRSFLRYIHPRHPRNIAMEEIRDYLQLLMAMDNSRSTIDQAINALRFLCVEVFGQPFSLENFTRPQKNKLPPVVLTLEEVKRIAVSAENPKHRLMIELAYSAGLRVSELVEVRVKQLNLGKLMLYVPAIGKGRKGRITIFSDSLKDALARQIGNKKPDGYLFPSERGGRLGTRAMSKFFKAALSASGVKKEATLYSLRHSFAIYLLRNGTDIVTLQDLLGHNHRSSTSVYNKVG